MPTLKALALSSAIASFGPNAGHVDSGAPQRLGTRQDCAVELDFALPDQREEKLRHRREIGFAERADAPYARVNATIQHLGDDLGELRRQAGGAARDAAQPDEQHGAHFFRGEEIPDPDRARHHGAMLEFPDVLGSERRVDGRAEPGIQSIDRPIAGGEFLDHRAGPAQARRDRACEANVPALSGNLDEVRDADALIAELHGAGRQRSTPLALRKSAATRRGSFLSTSTWRLSSCMVGLSSSAPTRSSVSTTFRSPAISMRTTGARK